MEIFKAEGFGFKYPKGENKALCNINLTVENGEFITIGGLSGSGKSTLLACLKGCAAGERYGKISAFNSEITDIIPPDKIGYVTQSPYAQAVTDKVWHELAFAAESLGISKQEMRVLVAQTAIFTGIERLMEKNTAELSGGQLQLVNLAAAMTVQPQVLLLDEPTAQLDPAAAQDFAMMLKKINRELGITVIVAEHNLQLFMPISSRSIIFDNGNIIADGNFDKVCNSLKNHQLIRSMSAGIQLCAAMGDNNFPDSITQSENLYKKYISCKSYDIPKKAEIQPLENETAVKLKDISFGYNKNEMVLDHLSLKINRCTAHFILGGNGCGKTTLLKIISGEIKPFFGTTEISGKPGYLPQEPAVLFCKSTVEEELDSCLVQGVNKDSIIKLCGLEKLLYRSPAELSGGETQRAAIAKLLSANPDILLLDEPTKGMDKQSCDAIAEIISQIKRQKTVIVVTHDLDFCAENADICTVIFDKSAAVSTTAEKLFCGGWFFTTEAARISRNIKPVITTDQLIYSCKGEYPAKSYPKTSDIITNDSKQPVQKQKISAYRKICTAAGIILALAVMVFFSGIIPVDTDKAEIPYLPYILISIPIALLFIGIAPKSRQFVTVQQKNYSCMEKIAAAVTLTVIPLTVIIGTMLDFQRKALILSLLVMAECFIPFMLCFEKKRPDAGRLTIIAVMSATAIVSRELFFMLPQFKPCAAIVIITASVLGAQSGFITGAVTMLVSNLLFGQGIWTPWQMLAMGLVGFFAGLIFRNKRSAIGLSIYGFFSVLVIYGGIMNLSQLLIYDSSPSIEGALALISAGVAFDLIHSAATVIFLLLLSNLIIPHLQRAVDKLR